MEDNSINITVIDREDQRHPIEIPLEIDLNIMEVCKSAELPVRGTCGGIALCSSCHCYVISDTELPEMSEAEEDMLDQAFDVMENSRLGCQLRITKDLDGLIIKLAPEELVTT